MKSTASPTTLLLSALLLASPAAAASIDMNDPHRALGRENDVRVDAQLSADTVSPGAPIGVTYQIQNFSDRSVAVADRVAQASYDVDSRTITIALGSEVPPDGNFPHMVLIEPGEKKIFRASANPSLNAAATRGRRSVAPRYVRIKVAILRNVQPFVPLIRQQTRAPRPLPDELFETWFESSGTIVLNDLPVRWSPERPGAVDAAMRGSS